MKRVIFSFVYVAAMCVFFISNSQAEIDLSQFSFDELVALHDRINLAIWNSNEWEEVTVPNGVWQVGSDIPEGHWSIMVKEGTFSTISYGNLLDNTGKEISYNSEVFYQIILSDLGDSNDIVSIDLLLQAGNYFVVSGSPVIFTPYSGKPDLGFLSKKNEQSDTATSSQFATEVTLPPEISPTPQNSLTSEATVLPEITPTPENSPAPVVTKSPEEVSKLVEQILSLKNGESEKTLKLIQENYLDMSKKQLEECLASYGRWAFIENAEEKIKSYLKSPRSYYRYSGNVGEPQKQDDGTYCVSISLKYGATNGFGAEITSDVSGLIYYSIDFDTINASFIKASFPTLDFERIRGILGY